MIKRGIDRDEAEFVMMNLRTKSADELAWQGIPLQAAINFVVNADFGWVIYHDDKPAALIGAARQHRGVYVMFGFGTDDWIKVWRLVTLVAKRDMMQAVSETGAHRAHCMSPADHRDTHKWLRFLGATHEVKMPKWGEGGEDYIMFSWLKDD